MLWDLLGWGGYFAGIAPLAVCVVLMLRHRDPPPDAWLLSAAFAVSYVADSFALNLAREHMTNWWVDYVYAPIQFGLILAVVAQSRAVRTVLLLGVAVLAQLSAWRGTLDAPETLVRVSAGLLAAWLVWPVPSLAPYRGPLRLFCLATACGAFLMAVVPREAAIWLYVWAVYRTACIVALCWMCRQLCRPLLALEVADGAPEPGPMDQLRPWLRLVSGGRGHGMEAEERQWGKR